MDEPLAALEQTRDTAADLAMSYGPRALAALLILVVGYFAGQWLGRVVGRILLRFELDATLSILLVRTVRVIVLGLFLIMALQNLGVELLPLVAGLGVAGAGIALAMQGVLGNVAAGLTILFTRPFRVGEYISIVGEEGRVESITLFSTTLGHVDRSLVVIPNRKIVGEILHNYGEIRQLELTVGVAYDTDLDSALEAIREVLAEEPAALDEPEPVIQVSRIADSSIDVAVRPWVRVPDVVATTGRLNLALIERFRRQGIVIPFPQREVRLLGGA